MRRLFGVVLLLALFALIWTGVWFFAARQAGAELDALLQSERDQGRVFTCPRRTFSGFPTELTLSCVDAGFEGKDGDRTVDVRVAAVSAEASLFHLRELKVTLLGPLTYKTSDGAVDLRASWASLLATVVGLPEAQTFRLDGHDVTVDGAFGATGRQGGTAQTLRASFSAVPGAPTPSLDFDIAIKGSSVPPLDDFLGGRAPVDATVAGRLDHADAAKGVTPEEAIENWRVAGGRVDLARTQLDHADSRVVASGSLMLDSAHRPEGRLDASFAGLGPVLARFGIRGDVSAATSLIGALLGGKPPAAEAPPGALNLPLQFRGGRLAIGPIRTDVELPPLY